MVNSCYDHKRRTRRLVPLAAGFLATLRASADSLADLLRSEVRTSVRTAVDRLSPALRMAIVLRWFTAWPLCERRSGCGIWSRRRAHWRTRAGAR